MEIRNVSGQLEGIVRWESRDRAVRPGDADIWRRRRREEIEARIEITPEDVRVLAAGRNRVLGLIRDSLDVEYLVGHDVELPRARGP